MLRKLLELFVTIVGVFRGEHRKKRYQRGQNDDIYPHY